MIEILILWVILGFLSFGVLGFHFVLMRKAAQRPWSFKIEKNRLPKISIIVPTYNESDVIAYKLRNLAKIEYPSSLIQVIVADSKSSDNTIEIVKDFAAQNSAFDLQISIEEKVKGKSAALNAALRHCRGDIVIVSDADCFYSKDILTKSLPYLSSPAVGAVSGPKLLLNSKNSRTVKTEEIYLNSMNLIKWGESKFGFTPLFEGGFSAYRKEVLESFDPYKTGSDDCGTVIKLAENAQSALFVPEAAFFTAFPETWMGKLGMKIRRANQLVRLFYRYLALLLKGRIRVNKRVVATDVFIYLFGPAFFVLFLLTTFMMVVNFPYFLVLGAVFFVPKVNSILIEVIQSYFILLFASFEILCKRKFLLWDKPGDRCLLTEDLLQQNGFI
jgi:biofilm PGA synthesis N-glycosyltransferase PgaC